METFIDFITFQDPNVGYVLLGMFFIHISTGLIGTFAFLRKRSLIGDAVAHAVLPGICLGFMLSGEKKMLYLMTGAFVTGWLSTFLVDFIVNRSRIKQDAAIGIVLSTFFGLGVVLLTYIQKHDFGNQAGLDQFLFGQAAAISKSDLLIHGGVALVVAVSVLIGYKAFKIISFNREFAAAKGLHVRRYEFLLTSLTVLAIASGIQALGVVLVSALLIAPSAAGRLWSFKLRNILLLALVFSMLSGFSGAYVSYVYIGMPTGPWVVVFLSLIIFVSILLSPQKGLLARYRLKIKNSRKILHENILKSIYQIHEVSGVQDELKLFLSNADLVAHRKFDTESLENGIRRMISQGFLERSSQGLQLTEKGRKESRRIIRLHRLWEQYLLKRTMIDTDHVHSGAEVIEHIITPELEKELEKELGIEGIPDEDY